MSELKKYEDLTKEQQQEFKKVGKKLVIKGLLTGANFGGLLFFSNLVLMMANAAFFQSTPLLFVLCVIVDMSLINMMRTANAQNAAEFREAVQKILDTK